MAFGEIGIELEFTGSGIDEKGVVVSASIDYPAIQVGQEVISIDPRYFRPTEVELLIGDPSKAKKKLGWSPKRNLAQLVKEMVASDIALFARDKVLKDAGHTIKNWSE